VFVVSAAEFQIPTSLRSQNCRQELSFIDREPLQETWCRILISHEIHLDAENM
jgi:hypothetical protein